MVGGEPGARAVRGDRAPGPRAARRRHPRRERATRRRPRRPTCLEPASVGTRARPDARAVRERRALRRATARGASADAPASGALRDASRARPLTARAGRLGGFGFAAPVEPLLEVTAQLLARRTQSVVRPPRLEPQDPHFFVTRPVAARVALGLRQ